MAQNLLILGGVGGSAGLEIVEASGTTLNAEVGKYYRFDSNVSNLTVTLPAPTDNTHACTIKFYFSTSSSPNVSFVSTLVVMPDDNYEINYNSVYEVTATYNGIKWVLSSRIVVNGNVLLRLGKTLEDQSKYGRTTTTAGTVTPNYNNEGILINSGRLILDTNIKNVITNKDYSLSLDVYPISDVASSVTCVSLGGSNTIGGSIGFIPSEDSISWYAGGDRIKATNIGFSYNRWYHIEWRRENGYFKLILNGTQIGTSDYSVTQNVMDFVIGANQSYYPQSMNGYVKNIVIKLL